MISSVVIVWMLATNAWRTRSRFNFSICLKILFSSIDFFLFLSEKKICGSFLSLSRRYGQTKITLLLGKPQNPSRTQRHALRSWQVLPYIIYYRKFILQITQPSQYRCTQLQYRCAVISEAPSTFLRSAAIHMGIAFYVCLWVSKTW